jgi:predicted metal-dependent peptidase
MTTATPVVSFDLNTHLHRVMRDEPFFAAISRRTEKVANTAIPTAGVRVNPDTLQFEMVYNPVFFNRIVAEHAAMVDNLPAAERREYVKTHRGDDGNVDPFVWVRGVILHELFHLVNGHVTHRLPAEGMTKKWNYATDLAINSHIGDKLPSYCLLPGRGDFASLPLGESAEYYMKNLPEDFDKNEGSGEGGGEGQIDSHDGWSDLPEDVKDMVQERARQMMSEAAGEANAKGWGSVSAATRKQIIDWITPKINWQAVLRAFVKKSQRADRQSTVRRLDRRQPYVWAGKRIRRQAKIAISIDQSGSVDDGMLSLFFGELSALSRFAEFTVIPFDTHVDDSKVYVWKKNQQKRAERVLCGGTCFDAPTKWVNERPEFDGHIILTDMCAPKPGPSKAQRLWITTPEHAKNPYFTTNEKVIAID